jgi:DNA invertase Pin-like site-specific DNA recombinase
MIAMCAERPDPFGTPAVVLARKRGIYTGRKPGTTKAKPSRARALKKQGLTIAEIAQALSVKQRTVYNYLSRSS